MTTSGAPAPLDPQPSTEEPTTKEPTTSGGTSHAAKLNWLRAGVLGANDGIISTAGLVVGVAGATTAIGPIVTAGVAGVVAGAVSMALGEYVSVSSQRDAERALAEHSDGALEILAGVYRGKGLSTQTAYAVAAELTALDPFAAHIEAGLRLDPNDLTNPSHAAISSGTAFTAGAILPIAAITLAPANIRIIVTFVAVLLALVVTGTVSARLGGAGKRRAVLRLVVGGAAAMAVTWGVGRLLGVSGI